MHHLQPRVSRASGIGLSTAAIPAHKAARHRRGRPAGRPRARAGRRSPPPHAHRDDSSLRGLTRWSPAPAAAAGWLQPARLNTMVSRPGSGRPMDSKVLRPITNTCPSVVALNHLKSSGKCHGMRGPSPMTRLSDMAAMAWRGSMGRGAGCVKRPRVRARYATRSTPHGACFISSAFSPGQ